MGLGPDERRMLHGLWMDPSEWQPFQAGVPHLAGARAPLTRNWRTVVVRCCVCEHGVRSSVRNRPGLRICVHAGPAGWAATCARATRDPPPIRSLASRPLLDTKALARSQTRPQTFRRKLPPSTSKHTPPCPAIPFNRPKSRSASRKVGLFAGATC